ncbi:fibronectin type III domain-containing protein, partial [Verrucomicrobia bacterium]|nr:fibronectin type III domain-containing protein [Verrucomicrobiota bacterium]
RGPGIELGGEFSFEPPNSVEIVGTAGIEKLDLSATFTMGFVGTRVDKVNLLLERETPIGSTGLFMYSIGGGVSNLTGNYIQIDAEASAGIGPQNIPTPWGEVALVHAEASTIIRSNGYFKLDGRGYVVGFEVGYLMFEHAPNVHVKVEGGFQMWGGVIRADGYLHYYMVPKILNGGAQVVVGTPHDWPIIGGITLARAWFDGHFNIPTGYVKLNGGIHVLFLYADITYYNQPQNTIILDLGWFFGRHVIKFADSMEFANTSGSNNEAIMTWESVDDLINAYHSYFEEWEIPFVHMAKVPETGGLLVMNKNFERLDRYSSKNGNRVIKKMGPDDETVILNVDPEHNGSKAVFRLNYENDLVDAPEVQLELPDKRVLDGNEGHLPNGYISAGNDESGPFAFANLNTGAREAYFSLRSAKSGQYMFTIKDAAKLGNYAVEVYRQNEKPTIDMLVASEPANKDGTVNTGMFQVDWIGSDADTPDAMVEFYLDTDSKIPNGIKAASKKMSELVEEETFTFPTDHLQIQPGWYYVYMVIDDNKNSPTIRYADEKIWVDRDAAPKPIESFTCTPGNKEFTIEWSDNKNSEDDVYYYDVYYGQENSGEIEYAMEIAHAGTTKRVVKGLTNGRPYLVSIVAVDREGNNSGKKVIKRVVPRAAIGSSKPIFLSVPVESATVGNNYYYQPNLFDKDTQTHTRLKEILLDNIDYQWKLVQGPDGMTVNQNTGLVSWVPPADYLKKDEKVSISVTKSGDPIIEDGGRTFNLLNNDITTTQSFNINVDVLPLNENNGGISSRPFLTAYPETEYKYELQFSEHVSDEEITLSLLQGPIQMDVVGTKLVWNVPTDAVGETIKVLAETNDGRKYTQEFFLHVYSISKESNSKPEILGLYEHEENQFKILFSGAEAKEYDIQITNSIESDTISWKTMKRYTSGSQGFNVHIHQGKTNEKAFFRLLQVED